MKIRLGVKLLLSFFCVFLIAVGFAGTKGGVVDLESPKLLNIAFPRYPELLVPDAYKETIEVDLKIDSDGKIIEENIKSRFIIVKKRISKALERWRFEKSEKPVRKATFFIEFDLLPYDADRQVSAEFILPDKIVVYENGAADS